MAAQRVLISGASGLVGTALTAALTGRGDLPLALVRAPRTAKENERAWDPSAGSLAKDTWPGINAVINLAGASIAEGRWTAARKKELVSSRVNSTRLLVQSIAASADRPAVFLSASAVGIYGSRGDEILSDAAPRGDQSFLTDLAAAWEAETAPLDQLGVRRVLLRFGVILSPQGGALKKMLLPFKLGLGGKLGSGTQYLSWIGLADVVQAILFLFDKPELSGSYNIVAPTPVTNAEFTQKLAHSLNRPAFFSVPALALRLALGEFAEAALLASQRATPSRLLEAGFQFQAPTLEAYFRPQP